MNIHHASLFPDVIGASGYCNELIREAIEGRKKLAEQSRDEKKDKQAQLELPDFALKGFVVTETNEILRELIHSLIVDEAIRGKVLEPELRKVCRSALGFIEAKAGPDWYDRDSQMARLKNILRRQLKNIQFPENFISLGAESLALKAAELSRKEDLRKMEHVGREGES